MNWGEGRPSRPAPSLRHGRSRNPGTLVRTPLHHAPWPCHVPRRM